MLVRSENRWLYRDVTRQTKNCSVWSAFKLMLPLWWWFAHLSRDNLGGSATGDAVGMGGAACQDERGGAVGMGGEERRVGMRGAVLSGWEGRNGVSRWEGNPRALLGQAGPRNCKKKRKKSPSEGTRTRDRRLKTARPNHWSMLEFQFSMHL